MIKNKKNRHLVITQVTPATNVVMSLICAIVALIFIIPIWMVIAMSLTSDMSLKMNGVQIIPSEWSLLAYKALLQVGGNMWRSYANSYFYAITDTLCHLFFCSMFGFVLARKDLKARNAIALFIYVSTMFSGGLAPTYILYTRILKLQNTVWVYLLPSMVSVGSVVTLRVFVTGSIDQALLESAKLDGANEFQIYYKICLPLLKPGLATVGMGAFVGSWNDWFTGTMYVTEQKLQPIMTFLMKIENTLRYLTQNNPQIASQQGMEIMSRLPETGVKMAITVLAVFPMLICYPFFQKHFIRDLSSGSVKG